MLATAQERLDRHRTDRDALVAALNVQAEARPCDIITENIMIAAAPSNRANSACGGYHHDADADFLRPSQLVLTQLLLTWQAFDAPKTAIFIGALSSVRFKLRPITTSILRSARNGIVYHVIMIVAGAVFARIAFGVD